MEYNKLFLEIVDKPGLLKPLIRNLYKESGEMGLISFKEHVIVTHDILPDLKKKINAYCDVILKRERNFFLKNNYEWLKWSIVFVVGTSLTIIGLCTKSK